jgi:hypothetical protein
MSKTDDKWMRPVAIPTPLMKRSGLDTIRAVETRLREALSEFLASPDRHDWQSPEYMREALMLESHIRSLQVSAEDLANMMQRRSVDTITFPPVLIGIPMGNHNNCEGA